MLNQSPKKLLFLNQNTPYGTRQAKESLDAALAAAVFGQHVSLLFMDDGVWQLLKQQTPEPQTKPNLANQWPAVEMYDIEHIYVEAQAMQQRGLDAEDLVVDTHWLNAEQISDLLEQQDVILSF